MQEEAEVARGALVLQLPVQDEAEAWEAMVLQLQLPDLLLHEAEELLMEVVALGVLLDLSEGLRRLVVVATGDL